jgi:hypothetical protein
VAEDRSISSSSNPPVGSRPTAAQSLGHQYAHLGQKRGVLPARWSIPNFLVNEPMLATCRGIKMSSSVEDGLTMACQLEDYGDGKTSLSLKICLRNAGISF